MQTETRQYLDTCQKMRQYLRPEGCYLIVEDDTDTAYFLQHLISLYKYKAVIVRTVKEALLFISKHAHEIRCAVVDLHLKNEEGTDILRYIENEHRQVPYFVYTAEVDADKGVEEEFPRARVVQKNESVDRLLNYLGLEKHAS